MRVEAFHGGREMNIDAARALRDTGSKEAMLNCSSPSYLYLALITAVGGDKCSASNAMKSLLRTLLLVVVMKTAPLLWTARRSSWHPSIHPLTGAWCVFVPLPTFAVFFLPQCIRCCAWCFCAFGAARGASEWQAKPCPEKTTACRCTPLRNLALVSCQHMSLPMQRISI